MTSMSHWASVRLSHDGQRLESEYDSKVCDGAEVEHPARLSDLVPPILAFIYAEYISLGLKVGMYARQMLGTGDVWPYEHTDGFENITKHSEK